MINFQAALHAAPLRRAKAGFYSRNAAKGADRHADACGIPPCPEYFLPSSRQQQTGCGLMTTGKCTGGTFIDFRDP